MINEVGTIAIDSYRACRSRSNDKNRATSKFLARQLAKERRIVLNETELNALDALLDDWYDRKADDSTFVPSLGLLHPEPFPLIES